MADIICIVISIYLVLTNQFSKLLLKIVLLGQLYDTDASTVDTCHGTPWTNDDPKANNMRIPLKMYTFSSVLYSSFVVFLCRYYYYYHYYSVIIYFCFLIKPKMGQIRRHANRPKTKEERRKRWLIDYDTKI